MKTLSKKAKGAVVGSVAGLGALALGLGIWQPWKKTVEVPEPPVHTQLPDTAEEKGPFITVNGEEISCTIYDGEGWSIYLPKGWTAVDGFLWPDKEGKPGLCLAVFSTEFEVDYAGDFASLWQSGRTFYTGASDKHWEVSHWGEPEDFEDYDKIFTAVARTFTVDGAQPFAETRIAREPDWQVTDDCTTVLWVDKDGVVLDDVAQQAVEQRMLSWDQEVRDYFTGQYALTYGPKWSASYNFGPENYMDVFTAKVSYVITPGREEERVYQDGMMVEDGWQTEWADLHLAVYHDGSGVTDIRPLWAADQEPGYPSFLTVLEETAEAVAEPAAETFTYGDLELEITNVTDVRKQVFTDDGGTDVEQMVFTCLPGAQITVVDADMSQPIVEGLGSAHPNWALDLNGGTDLRDGMAPVLVPDEGCMVYDPESSVGVLLIKIKN